MVDELTHGCCFRLASRDKGLPAVAGIDRHDQDDVHVGDDFLERADRRRRVERDTGFEAERVDRRDRPVQVGGRLEVHGDDAGPGPGERLEITLGKG